MQRRACNPQSTRFAGFPLDPICELVLLPGMMEARLQLYRDALLTQRLEWAERRRVECVSGPETKPDGGH
jgi:hypothetical protein